MPTAPDLAVSEHRPAHPVPGSPVVVLVHGSLDRAGSFARVVRRLTDLTTCAYDRRGYHRSRGGPVHTTVAGHVDDLLTVVAGRPAVVVGHSFGGVIALAAALRPGGPAPVVGLGAFEPPLPWVGGPARRPGAPRHPGEQADAPGAVAERFFRRMVGDAAWERLPESTREARRADGAALAAELDALRVDEPPFDVAGLDVPLLVGRGSASLPHHRAAAAWLADHAPGAALVEIEGAGHGAHLTHPDAFAGFVRAAVARALSDRATH